MEPRLYTLPASDARLASRRGRATLAVRRACAAARPERVGEAVDVVVARSPAEADADRAGGERRLDPHRRQHVRRRHLARRTGRAGATATPARSRAISSVAAATPGTAKQSVLGRRGAAAPKTTASGAVSRTAPASRSRSAASRGARPPSRSAAAARRRAEAGDRRDVLGAGARAALLPAAAQQRLAEARPDIRRDQRARALRAAELVGGKDEQIGAERREARSARPASCTASQTTNPPAAWTSAAASATGCSTPVSLLAPCSASSGRPGRAAGFGERVEVDPAVGAQRRDLDRGRGKRWPRRTQGCSPAETISRAAALRLPDAGARRQRRVGRLGAPETKTTLRAGRRRAGDAPGRLFDDRARGAPSAWIEDGLPRASSAATIAARASGRNGAVAL